MLASRQLLFGRATHRLALCVPTWQRSRFCNMSQALSSAQRVEILHRLADGLLAQQEAILAGE